MLWGRFTIVIVMIAALIFALIPIHFGYQHLRQDYQTLKRKYQAQVEAVKSQQQKLVALHQLDIQHVEELKNAKAELDKLRDAVRAGTKRLHVKTVCPAPKTATTKSRHNEVATQLGEAAREDYFHLRAMIVENEKQTQYLQQYIKTQCQ